MPPQDANPTPSFGGFGLKLDQSDSPHIVYFEVTDRRPLNGVVRYAKGTPR